MGDSMRSPTAGRELVRLGRRGGRSPMRAASVSGRLGEAQARRRPAPPAAAGPERPRRARSCSRTREIVASTILAVRGLGDLENPSLWIVDQALVDDTAPEPAKAGEECLRFPRAVALAVDDHGAAAAI